MFQINLRFDSSSVESTVLISKLFVTLLSSIETAQDKPLLPRDTTSGLTPEMWNRMIYIILKYAEAYPSEKRDSNLDENGRIF